MLTSGELSCHMVTQLFLASQKRGIKGARENVEYFLLRFCPISEPEIMDSAEFHAAVCFQSHLGIIVLTFPLSTRYMTLYDAFLPAASQAMVRFNFGSIFIIAMLNVSMGMLFLLVGHIAKLTGMPNYSRHVGQDRQETAGSHISI